MGDSKLAVGANVSGCFFVSALQHPRVLLWQLRLELPCDKWKKMDEWVGITFINFNLFPQFHVINRTTLVFILCLWTFDKFDFSIYLSFVPHQLLKETSGCLIWTAGFCV